VKGGPYDILRYNGRLISSGGFHVGVEAEGYIFDNFVNGSSVSDWKEAITSSGNSDPDFKTIPFDEWIP
jgi:hypothetical protein